VRPATGNRQLETANWFLSDLLLPECRSVKQLETFFRACAASASTNVA